MPLLRQVWSLDEQLWIAQEYDQEKSECAKLAQGEREMDETATQKEGCQNGMIIHEVLFSSSMWIDWRCEVNGEGQTMGMRWKLIGIEDSWSWHDRRKSEKIWKSYDWIIMHDWLFNSKQKAHISERPNLLVSND